MSVQKQYKTSSFFTQFRIFKWRDSLQFDHFKMVMS